MWDDARVDTLGGVVGGPGYPTPNPLRCTSGFRILIALVANPAMIDRAHVRQSTRNHPVPGPVGPAYRPPGIIESFFSAARRSAAQARLIANAQPV